MHQGENGRATAKKQALIVKANNNLAAPESLGERLSWFLVIIMEVCLVYAILLVQAGFSSASSGPLLPIWAIFLIFLGFYWLAHSLSHFVSLGIDAQVSPGLRKALAKLVMSCAVLVCLVLCVWLHLYAQSYSLLDLAWFQALSNDLSQFDSATQILALGVLLCIIVWLSQLTVKGEAEANGAMLLSKGGLFLAILAGVSLSESFFGSNPAFWQAFLLLPVFFWSGLTLQALQKASAKRRYHAVGLEGNTRHQEQIIFRFMLLLGLVALVAAVVIMQTHGIVLPLISRMIAAPMLPTSDKHTTSPIPVSAPPTKPPKRISNLLLQFAFTNILVTLLIIAAGILILGLIALCLLLWLTRRKKQAKKKQDETESLWSWSLFLTQLKAFLLSFFPFLPMFRRKSKAVRIQAVDETQSVTPAVHTIREVYRAFLRKAVQRGYPREQDETPYEFHARLHAQEPQIDPELEAITEAYALARYGGKVPREDEIVRIKETWRDLDRKWQQNS